MSKYYKENNKRGYLNEHILPDDSQVELQDIDYGGVSKDRNIPRVVDKLMRLVIWGIQYPNPSAAPDREIVTAIWSGSGQVFNIVRAQEDTEAGDHYVGDNIALLFTADMSREILIFEDFENSIAGSIAYTDDTDEDGEMEVVALPPDNEVSEEGYKKVLVSGGVGEAPYWAFAFAEEVGASKSVDIPPDYSVSPFYMGTDESPSGDDLFEIDSDWNKIHESQEGHAVNGIYDIAVQPSTNRIIVAGNQIEIFESDWTSFAFIPNSGRILIDPDDDDYMYVHYTGGIWKYHIGTQVLQWQNTTYKANGACISGTTGKLYVCGGTPSGINEINRSTGAWVRNLTTARGHGYIAWCNDHLYAAGARQFSKSIWKYDEATGALATSYDTGGGTNRVIIFGGNIFVCGQRTNTYNPAGGITGYKTIFRFNDILQLERAYDDGNTVYANNDMGIDLSKNYLVVTSKGAVDEDSATANVRWFNSELTKRNHILIYDNISTCVATAYTEK